MSKGTRLPRFVSPEETDRLFAVATRKELLALEILYSEGPRVSEMCALTWADVDLGEEPYLRFKGKGGDERQVPLGVHCANALRAAQDGHGPSDRVFPFTRVTAWRWLRTLGEKADIPDLHPHTLRHAFASHQLNRGASLPAVADMMGHKSWQTTADYYWQLADPRLHAMHRCVVTCLPRARRYLMAHPHLFVDLIEGQIDP